jgi:hypothetical protein
MFVDSVGEAFVSNLQFQMLKVADCGLCVGPSNGSPSCTWLVRDPCAKGVLCQKNNCTWVGNSKSQISVCVPAE